MAVFKKIAVSFLVIISFTSCEDVIQIKLDEGAKLLVVDAFINDMRVSQNVRLTQTDSYFSGQNPPPVTNATVTLKDITVNKTYTFVNNNNGDYQYAITATDTIAFIDHSYELTINYDGKTYTSFTKQKRTTVIDSITYSFKEKNSFTEEGFYCKFWAFDPPGAEPDYYWVKAFKNGTFFNKGSQINLAFDGAYSAGADGFIFIPPIAEAITPFGERYAFGDVCRVEIHSISKETYFFLIQVQTQTTNSGLFATTPENVRTNINTPEGATKAIGWFNMASVGALNQTIN
jgi:hypothetical protein